MWSHIEKHWIMYYLGIGVAFTVYDYVSTSTSFSVTGALVETLTWPVHVISYAESFVTTATAPKAS
jgi:hypothetical protein